MYKIIGADQREYGPVSADQIRQWLREGRANGQTLIRFEEGPWKPLSTFSEFAADLATSAPPAALPPAAAPGYMVGQMPKNNGMAVAGLILSVLGLLGCCGPITSTLGLIFSIIGLSQINDKPQIYTGKTLAIAGIVIALLGYVLVVVLWTTGAFDRVFRELHLRQW